MSFFTSAENVAQQVIILFILIAAGVVAGKRKWIDDAGSKQLSTILFQLVTVCVILKAFLSVSLTASRMYEMMWSAISCVLTVGLGAGISHIVFRNAEQRRKAVLKFGVAFSNSGFISLPLAEAILGDEGVFIVSAYVAVFNMLIWTYGVNLFHPGKSDYKKLLLNPGVIGVIIGMVLMSVNISLPSIIMVPVRSFADLNTPLAMIVVGFYLSKMTLKWQKGDGMLLLGSLLRLVICPALIFGIFYLSGLRGTLLCACMIPVCAPCAGNTSIFAVLFHGDTMYASRFIGVCTVLSMFTMPFIIGASLVL